MRSIVVLLIVTSFSAVAFAEARPPSAATAKQALLKQWAREFPDDKVTDVAQDGDPVVDVEVVDGAKLTKAHFQYRVTVTGKPNAMRYRAGLSFVRGDDDAWHVDALAIGEVDSIPGKNDKEPAKDVVKAAIAKYLNDVRPDLPPFRPKFPVTTKRVLISPGRFSGGEDADWHYYFDIQVTDAGGKSWDCANLEFFYGKHHWMQLGTDTRCK